MVSIVITTYGGGSQLRRAIESVLTQTYQAIEVIVVDDNDCNTKAREKTEHVMSEYSDNGCVKYIRHEKNKNGAAARNTGIYLAKGRYISFLDDDDFYFPERLEKIIQFLERNPDFVGVYTGVEFQDGTGAIIKNIVPDCNLTVDELLLNEMAIGTGSNIFVKKEMIEKVHGFDEQFIRRQDIEFMIRICECGKVGYIPDILVVKSVNGIANHPKYEKMKSVISQFTSKFDVEISRLGERTNDFYCLQYRTLLGIAFYEKDSAEIKEALSLMKKYGSVTWKEKILAFVYIHHLRDLNLVNGLLSMLRKCNNHCRREDRVD